MLTRLHSVVEWLPCRDLTRVEAAPRDPRSRLTRLPTRASRRCRLVREVLSQILVIVAFVEMCLLLVVRQFSALLLVIQSLPNSSMFLVLIALLIAVRRVALQAPGGNSIRTVRQKIHMVVSSKKMTVMFVSAPSVLGSLCPLPLLRTSSTSLRQTFVLAWWCGFRGLALSCLVRLCCLRGGIRLVDVRCSRGKFVRVLLCRVLALIFLQSRERTFHS